MRRLLAVVPVLALLALAVPATAHSPSLKDQYRTLYPKAVEAVGKESVGRHIVKYGMPAKGEDRPATKEEIAASVGVMDRWVNPPPVPQLQPTESLESTESVDPGTASTASTASTGGTGGTDTGGTGSGNATVQCESGGDYSINTGNGYYGGYQFDSGTWDAYGDSAYPEAHLAPPAVQDQAAAAVPYDAWPNC